MDDSTRDFTIPCKHNFRAIEAALADIEKNNKQALVKLNSSEFTVQSLQKELGDLRRTESLSRVHKQNDRMLEDLKRCHQKEVSQYKENIDDLRNQLTIKSQFADNLLKKYSELQVSYQRILGEKSESLIKMEKIQGQNNLLKEDLYYGGEHPRSFRCPFCWQMGLTRTALTEHLAAEHSGSSAEIVIQAIISCEDEQGISVSELYNSLKSLSRQSIQEALDLLSDEGHIYSTIDEDHFKSTDCI